MKPEPTDPDYAEWFADLSPRQQHAEWFARLSPTEQDRARELKVHRFLSPQNYYPGEGEDALESAESEIIPEALRRGVKNGIKPIVAIENPTLEAIEPQKSSVQLVEVSVSEIDQAAEVFELSLRWGLSITPAIDSRLVGVGKRSNVIIAAMRPSLAGGLKVDAALARGYIRIFRDACVTDTAHRLTRAGSIYGRALEWMRRATTFGGFGERLQLVAYALRPDLIDEQTLEQLGAETGKTRQAISKSVNGLRDTFAGLRALTQRSDATRLRCQQAQRALL